MSRKIAVVEVVGVEPAPQGSKRYLGNGRFVEASKKLEPWRKAVAEAVEQMFEQTGDRTPFTEACRVEVEFILPKPKTVTRTWPTVTPDVDKLCRGFLDSISLERYSLLVQDDSLVCELVAIKRYGTSDTMGARAVISLL